jgi:hypothetical protein
MDNVLGPDIIYRRATAVINIAAKHGLFEGVMPEEANERAALAEHIAKKAYTARDKGNAGDAVTEILYTWEVELRNAVNDNNGKDKTPEERKYEAALTEFTKENLPVPPEIEGDPPLLPLDFSNESPKTVRYLHSAFNACAARVGYLLAIEEAGEKSAKQIADEIFNKWLIAAERKDEQTGRPKTKEVLHAEALDADDNLGKWRGRQSDHSIKAGKLKSLFDYYNDSAERLNKEAIMRQMERE